LAKAKDPTIARRAALSAPPEFLVRLLQCSGLPKSSFLSMINRLGRLGDESSEADKVFRRYLSPLKLSKWDIARNKGHKSLTKVLLGRIAAYKRLHQISPDEESSSMSFQRWLLEAESKPQAKHDKGKMKDNSKRQTKALINDFTRTLEDSMVSESAEAQESSGESAVDSTPFKETQPKAGPLEIAERNSTVDLQQCLESGEVERIEWCLQNSFLGQSKNGRKLAHDAITMYEEFSKLSDQNQRRVSSLLVRWFPLLANESDDEDKVFKVMFRQIEESKTNSPSFESRLILECSKVWDQARMDKCIAWITDPASQGQQNDAARMAQFLVLASNQLSLTHSFFETDETTIPMPKSGDESMIRSGAITAVEFFKEQSGQRSPNPFTSSSAKLLLLLADRGRDEFRIVCDTIVSNFSENAVAKLSQLEVFLRLYLQHPQWIDLTSDAVNGLMEASQKFSSRWTEWWSTYDGRIDDILQSMQEGDAKPVKELSEIARKQPLLLLRKFPAIANILLADATIDTKRTKRSTRGTVVGNDIQGTREVIFLGQLTQVSWKHWGYELFEPMWIAWLDILSHIPKMVLFSCGPSVGFNSLLNVYVQLLQVQLQLMSANDVHRLRDKLKGLFQIYRQSNAPCWSSWLRSTIGTSEVRHALMGCDLIDIKEASDQFQQLEKATQS
jgi:hypothetical protein